MIPVWKELFLRAILVRKRKRYQTLLLAILPQVECTDGQKSGSNWAKVQAGVGTAAIPHPMHFQMISTQVNLGPFFPLILLKVHQHVFYSS